MNEELLNRVWNNVDAARFRELVSTAHLGLSGEEKLELQMLQMLKTRNKGGHNVLPFRHE